VAVAAHPPAAAASAKAAAVLLIATSCLLETKEGTTITVGLMSSLVMRALELLTAIFKQMPRQLAEKTSGKDNS
jgi:hypothetical protein